MLERPGTCCSADVPWFPGQGAGKEEDWGQGGGKRGQEKAWLPRAVVVEGLGGTGQRKEKDVCPPKPSLLPWAEKTITKTPQRPRLKEPRTKKWGSKTGPANDTSC